MRGKAFVFTMDAVLSFFVVIGFSNALIFLTDQNENLNREYLHQISQDIMEVCSKKFDFSQECFGLLNKTSGIHYSFFKNGFKEFGEDGVPEITIVRHFSVNKIELRVWS